jgi:MarR family transcriptional regulator, lower aerobic nicotinate degradation pathway regulator
LVEFQTGPQPRPRQLLRWPTYVMGQLSRTAASQLDAALTQEGLSLRTHQVLACLVEFGQVSQQQVCDATAVDRSDMVRLVDQLEQLGQVVRDRDPADRRRHLLTLTPAGRSALSRGERVIARVTDEVLSKLSGPERRTLHRLALRALGEPPDLADDRSTARQASHPRGSSR